ncbi:MAG: hypothetical protein PHT00_01230 [Candidatus Methanomethylophilus sp.]|nr:hypothetical protein [Methanomethylophilus sp.]MDD4668920.1 hypothetical protein [Methanomethylophilus sp.]
MNRDKKLLTALAVVIIAVVLIGEVLAYANVREYNANVTYRDEEASWSVSSNGSSNFNFVISDNGTFTATDEYIIYYDETYCTAYDSTKMTVIGQMNAQEYYIDQLIKTLAYKGVTDIAVVDAAALAEKLTGDLAETDCTTALIVVSGALPATVYTGQTDDLILQWLDNGGRLYWSGNALGRYYSTENELFKVSGYQELFFGIECLNGEIDDNKAYEDVTANNYRYVLSLSNNQTLYGVDSSNLSNCLTLGYTDGQYSSIALVQHGNGMICIFGGNYTDYQRADLSQVIAAGLCYCSEIVYENSGSVIRTTVTGTAQLLSATDNYAGYIYIGGYFPSFGRTFYS